jgi:hypothetical protein
MTLQRGELVPHFEVRTASGEPFSYTSIWQRKSLVLISLSPAEAGDEDYLRELSRHDAEFGARGSICVATRNEVPGLPVPGVLIADKWGEIIQIVAAAGVADMLGANELLDWVEYVASRCPECEGEAR